MEATTTVSGSGSPDTVVPPVASVFPSAEGTTTVIRAGHLTLTVLRIIGADRDSGGSDDLQKLVGTWPDHNGPALLALAQAT